MKVESTFVLMTVEMVDLTVELTVEQTVALMGELTVVLTI